MACSVMERSMEAMLLLLFFLNHFTEVAGDVGTAASYDPPYLSTNCPDYSRVNQLPETGLFVAAGSGVWDNGAACGRKYQVRCLSGLRRPCKDGSIVVEVVDYCKYSPCPATFLLSNKAFGVISRIPNAKINIEYTEI
ncbi:EG45-like domain containing protein isoform X1 [Curcuma longa]|uniref:EG45-like domain containing protein isoform X1 n=2 Tax=Curcuma longa TaxID=136217 RepID=UPI003D9E098E